MRKRSSGKIRVLALDLEHTLIDCEDSPFPRPGLYYFLEMIKPMFDRVVVYTAVREKTFRTIAERLVRRGEAPNWLRDVEYVKWPRQLKKDLSFIPGVQRYQVIIVDDHGGYICPEDLFRWVKVSAYDPINDYIDRELSRVLGVLELIHLGCVKRDRVVDYLKFTIDQSGSGVRRLYLYGDLAKSDTAGPDTYIKVAFEAERSTDTCEQLLKRLQFFFWVPVKRVSINDQRYGIAIQNHWHRFCAIIERSPGRVYFRFPGLAGCEGVHENIRGDEDFDSYTIHTIEPATKVLEAWLKTNQLEQIPTKEEMKKEYPETSILEVSARV
tara:strand:- start:647 stop:1624 length:978 start_codon:yes stop_codon:yes gene_type:complete